MLAAQCLLHIANCAACGSSFALSIRIHPLQPAGQKKRAEGGIVPNEFSLFGTKIVPNKLNSLGTKVVVDKGRAVLYHTLWKTLSYRFYSIGIGTGKSADRRAEGRCRFPQGGIFMTSIRDVAREAGVAISTVSKVLNHYPNVSPETRNRVEEAVRKLQFVPNAAAATLSSKVPARICLVINSAPSSRLNDEISMQYLSGAINCARKLGLDVTIAFSYSMEERSVEASIQYLRTQNVGGLVVCTLDKTQTRLIELINSGEFCTVVIDAPFLAQRTSNISIDNESAQYEVAGRMLEENHCSRVLYLAGDDNGYVSAARLDGMKRLAREKKLTLMVRNGHFSERRAQEITRKYGAQYDAVVCASDMMALGAMRELNRMDIFRPVCGFDGLKIMGYAGKQMYTVRQSFDAIAAESILEVQRLMAGESGKKIVMPYKIVRMTYDDVID